MYSTFLHVRYEHGHCTGLRRKQRARDEFALSFRAKHCSRGVYRVRPLDSRKSAATAGFPERCSRQPDARRLCAALNYTVSHVTHAPCVSGGVFDDRVLYYYVRLRSCCRPSGLRKGVYVNGLAPYFRYRRKPSTDNVWHIRERGMESLLVFYIFSPVIVKEYAKVCFVAFKVLR